MIRPPRWLLRVSLALLLMSALLAGATVWLARGSLAMLDGQRDLAGLSAPVTVQRDALGVVTIDAGNEIDAARSLGFVHGQERFFEMDLLRRSAAGELSALFGPVAIERDKQLRIHRLRARTLEQIDAVLGDQRAVLEAYRDGVNAGVAALREKPWPYLLLRTDPEPWRLEDSALAGYAMFLDLQDETNARELALWRIRETVPPALYALIAHDGSEWDAPLRGQSRGNASLPTTEQLDLRQLAVAQQSSQHAVTEPLLPGSNNFAVAGSLTADGRAIVANDMHLGLRAPGLWFRARLRYTDARAPAGRVDVSGFTLPGIPAVIVGSNGHVAWGFTNSYGDWLDFYRVEWLDSDQQRYRVPEGAQAIRQVTEQIAVKGAATVALPIRETRWGPITTDQADGSSLALRWTAHLPGALNFDLSAMARAGNLDQALAIADDIGIPAQNLMLADQNGRIGWRLTGQIPERQGNCDARAPLRVDTPCRWTGWVAATENPAVIDPPSGRLWTANNRLVDGAALALVGDGGYANGARARQIRIGLYAKKPLRETDLLDIALDDRALFLTRWWKLLQHEGQNSGDESFRQLAAASANWDGHATPASVSYRVVRAWRLAVIELIQNSLTAPAQQALGDDFMMPELPQIEGVAWPLLQQRPANLLPRPFENWEGLLAAAASETRRQLSEQGPLAKRTWGERNTAAICHPLASALPGPLKSWLCMTDEPLPGDNNMPRVQGPSFGASERMVVSPGHEAEGIIHMPGGQSGHPLSPFWGAGHEAWVRGEPSPFLPGPVTHALTLRPASH